jgi:hypothetical protein
VCQQLPYSLTSGKTNNSSRTVTGNIHTATFQCNAIPSANLRALNCDAYDQLGLNTAAKRSRPREVELAGHRARGVLGARTDVMMQLSGVAAIWSVANGMVSVQVVPLKERRSQALCQRAPAL